MQISREAARELIRVERWIPWIERGVRVLVILILAWALTRIARRLLMRLRTYTMRMMDRHGEVSAIELEKRAATIITALSKVLSTVIWIVAIVMALNELTFHIEPLLAGLGVAGIAVGLGAQTLIKDWLGGFLVLLEDQIRIGDGVTINGLSGTVEEINLRTTVLRAESGAVHIISNGSISTITNLTREYAYYIFEVTLAHGADVDTALSLLRQTGDELSKIDDLKAVILAPLEVLGAERIADRGVVVRARVKTLPGKQGLAGRELNRRMNSKLAAAGIEFPRLA